MEPDLTIVLIGNSGVGKSASGNTILGQKVFESRLAFNPVTKQITPGTCAPVFGKRISVVDTPGILDTKDTEAEISAYCQELLQSNRPCLFLVVVRIARFTPEEEQAVEAAIRALGPRGIRKSYLLFTHGDALKDRRLHDFIFEQVDVSLPNAVMKFGGAYHTFNNELQDPEQVRNLLLKTGYIRTPVPEEPVSLEGRRIVLLGRPGGGKSSSGNTILGSEEFNPDCDFDTVTSECLSGSAEVQGRQVTVVDTPGFTDEVLSPEQLYMEIMKTILMAPPGPHAFVIVVRIGRVSEADIKLFELLPKLFGTDASKYTMVLFTHGDELRGQSIDQKVKNSRSMSELVSMCGGRYCVFDNNQRGNTQQVRNLLNKVDEMVTESGGTHCTSEMFAMAETFIRAERNLSAPRGTRPQGVVTFIREQKNLSGGFWQRIWQKIKPYMSIVFGAVVGAFVGALAGGLAGGFAGAAISRGGVVAVSAAISRGGGVAVSAAISRGAGKAVSGMFGVLPGRMQRW
ncbi:GTPase IMAP family member 8-like [Scophthalmus maximus]|uniref:GTPase IMAP family member 8-like n=1 Tax=Scophthalmus maximus TaxID=52904 RepID=UPI001FA836C2|nr:GTPase IMAP family member 8-like [Scophthalmus maximus]